MRNHKWYMSGRQITVHDIYSFDPNVNVELEEFIDIIGRNFRQPEQGLGFDNSPVAHMWRAMISPAKYLESRSPAREFRKGFEVMPTLDSQVHAYERNHPGRPWARTLHRPPERTRDQTLSAMHPVA